MPTRWSKGLKRHTEEHGLGMYEITYRRRTGPEKKSLVEVTQSGALIPGAEKQIQALMEELSDSKFLPEMSPENLRDL